MRQSSFPPESLRPDLHTHSSFSDGLYAPGELCAMAVAAGVTHIALCDHDTLAGLAPMEQAVAAHNAAVADNPGASGPLAFLPSVEISAGPGGKTHILGYGAKPEHAELASRLAAARERRRERFVEMLRLLAAMGIHVPPEQCPPLGGQLPAGRAHLARALVATGTVSTVDQAFTRFLAEGKPAYVPYDHINAVEAVALVRRAGCIPVLAHPFRLSLSQEALFALISALAGEGLMGLEVFHPSASRRNIRALAPFARRAGLLLTGGSDFHGDLHAQSRLGVFPSGWSEEDIHAFLVRAAQ